MENLRTATTNIETATNQVANGLWETFRVEGLRAAHVTHTQTFQILQHISGYGIMPLRMALVSLSWLYAMYDLTRTWNRIGQKESEEPHKDNTNGAVSIHTKKNDALQEKQMEAGYSTMMLGLTVGMTLTGGVGIAALSAAALTISVCKDFTNYKKHGAKMAAEKCTEKEKKNHEEQRQKLKKGMAFKSIAIVGFTLGAIGFAICPPLGIAGISLAIGVGLAKIGYDAYQSYKRKRQGSPNTNNTATPFQQNSQTPSQCKESEFVYKAVAI